MAATSVPRKRRISPARGRMSLSSTPCDRYWNTNAADANTAAHEMSWATGVRLNFRIRPLIGISIIRLFYALVPILSPHTARRPGRCRRHQSEADDARGDAAQSRRRHLQLSPPGAALAEEARDHRARGNESRRRGRAADADHSAGRAVDGIWTLEALRKRALAHQGSPRSLDETYEKMRIAYSRVFTRCALDHVPVEADTGNIGGLASHEFMVLAQSGEDAVVSCPNCKYGANIEKATSKFFQDEPEPALMIELAPLHTPGTQSIDDVGRFLKKPTSELVKTLVFDSDKGCVMVLIRGDREGNLIKIKNYLGAEWLEMLPDSRFQDETGGPIGYCGPVGTKAKRVLADVSLKPRRNWIVGGNKRDTHLGGANPGGDFTTVFAGDPCPRCRTPLEIYRGIEVGHIFKLGTKYSEPMNCTYLDEK